jgi:hypothetical protein
MWPKMTKGDNQLLNIRLARLNLRILVQLLPALKWHLRYFHCSLPYLKETCMFLDLKTKNCRKSIKLSTFSISKSHNYLLDIDPERKCELTRIERSNSCVVTKVASVICETIPSDNSYWIHTKPSSLYPMDRSRIHLAESRRNQLLWDHKPSQWPFKVLNPQRCSSPRTKAPSLIPPHQTPQ